MNINNEEHILRKCLEAIKGLLGQDPGLLQQPNLAVQLLPRPGVALLVECRRNIAIRAQALHIVNQIQARGHKPAEYLVCAQWIAGTAAEELRKAGVCHVDTTGNAYIVRRPQLLIDVRGRRPEARIRPEPGRIVEAGGLKVCHLLLTHPKMLEQPLRMVAEKAGVALGTAHAVMRELVTAGMVLPGEQKKRRFGDVEGMIDAFVRGYTNKLRPACFLNRYRHKKAHPEDILDDFKKRLDGTGARWALTGGLAGNRLTQFLAPNTITLFADPKAAQLLREEPMLPDRNGNVTLLDLFADIAVAGFVDTAAPMATPLLVYAELLDEGGPREAETAEMVLEKHVMPGVGLERRPR